jgi:alpha-tubulin suppressor-like RCC1 family protein
VADPVLTVSGTSTSQQTESVTVTEATSGVTVNYTTDGTIPTQSSLSLTSPTTLLIPINATLKVQAFQSATVTSNLVSTQMAHSAIVSAGTAHTLFLKNNGTVYATGDNSAGELGNGTTTNSTQPVEVLMNISTPLTGIVAIAADNNESMAVDNQGRVWAWGLNTNGELGTGNATATPYATQVSGLSNMLAIASGQNHTVALKADGSVWSWGANGSGQVGNGTVSAWVTQPVQVIAPATQSGPYLQSIVAVAAGFNHSLAVDNTGKVYAWGDNTYGELGDGDAALLSQLQPVQVKNNTTPITNVVGIVADGTNSFAIENNGNLFAWGDNTIGELGNGTTSAIGTPVNLSPGQVVNLGAMAMVSNQSAMDSTGTVWTWGDNTNGRLGIGYAGYYATVPLAVSLVTQPTPILTAIAGNNQTVTDGTFSGPLTISASSGQGTWVNLIINPTNGLLALNSGGTQLSPIIGGTTGSGGTINFYLQAPANGSGSVSLEATSGASVLSTLSAVEQMAQQIASDTPTMPQWALIVMAGLLVFTARQKMRAAK